MLLLPVLAACPFGGGPTTCTTSVESALESARGRATQTDAGTLVTLDWPNPETPSELPLEYFQQARLSARGAGVNRFTVASTTRAEAEFSPLDVGFSFTLTFPEPDRLGLGGCKGQHGGMNDQIELEVDVSAPRDAGTRAVSTSAAISLGAY